jgi:hypothetical protein
MTTQPWQIISWEPLPTSLETFRDMSRAMRNLGIAVHSRGPDGLCTGQVAWGMDAKAGPAGIAWDWAEVRAGVLAMADPMTILSNIVLLSPDTEQLVWSERLLKMHEAIHRFTWQSPVSRFCAGIPGRPDVKRTSGHLAHRPNKAPMPATR